MTLSEFMKDAAELLSKSSNRSPEHDVKLLVSDLLNISLMELCLHGNIALSEPDLKRLQDALTRRAANEPIQYITGCAYFRNLKLSVGHGVLIPRPETEIIAGLVIKNAPPGALVCDIGTGSGAIALSIAQERADLHVTGIDINQKALSYAEENLRNYNFPNVRLLQGNLFDTVQEEVIFDVIIANLPYVTEEEYSGLDEEVAAYEPELALLGGTDGLDIIRKLIENAPSHMKSNGKLILEFGSGHDEKIKSILSESKKFKDIEIIKDLAGIARFSSASKI